MCSKVKIISANSRRASGLTVLAIASRLKQHGQGGRAVTRKQLLQQPKLVTVYTNNAGLKKITFTCYKEMWSVKRGEQSEW